MDGIWIGLAALVPSIGVGILFYFVMRFVIRSDKNERAQLAELDQLSDQSEGNSNSKQ